MQIRHSIDYLFGWNTSVTNQLIVLSGWADLQGREIIALNSRHEFPVLAHSHYMNRPDVNALLGPCYDVRHAGYGFFGYLSTQQYDENLYLVAARDDIEPLGEYKAKICQNYADFIKFVWEIPVPPCETTAAYRLLVPEVDARLREVAEIIRYSSVQGACGQGRKPSVSIVIPIAETTELIASQCRNLFCSPGAAECLEVIYAIADPTLAEAFCRVIYQIRKLHTVRLKWLIAPMSIPKPLACNLGAALSSAPFLAFMDETLISVPQNDVEKPIELLRKNTRHGALGCDFRDMNLEVQSCAMIFVDDYAGKIILQRAVPGSEYGQNGCLALLGPICYTDNAAFLQYGGFPPLYPNLDYAIADYTLWLKEKGRVCGLWDPSPGGYFSLASQITGREREIMWASAMLGTRHASFLDEAGVKQTSADPQPLIEQTGSKQTPLTGYMS